jgi:alanine-glyoxylate transaminase/(R)-3-amino-2-methylpropionate-pyruvate transaminase
MQSLSSNVVKSVLRRAGFGFAQEMPQSKVRPAKYEGRSFENVLATRKKHMPEFQFYYYKEPLLITEGHGQYLFDYKGKQYLDLCAGISTVNCGHSHPRITKVVQDQIGKLGHISPIFLQEYQGEYCKQLAETLGPEFDQVFLVNSGAEANDFAILLSRLYTGASKVLSLRYGYHGLVGASQGVTNVSTWNHPVVRGYDIEKLAFPATYRGLFKGGVDEYVKEAEEVIGSCTSGKIACFIAEPIQGVAGAYPLPPTYLTRMYEVIRKYGGLCIADEVQTGFGRAGKNYWGFRTQGAKPDIVTMAKGIGNGFPMAAVATRKEVMDSIKKVHFNTFGGGLLQSRIGMEVLNIIKDEKLHENAETVGNYLQQKLREVGERNPVLGDVRGSGLMVAIEFVKDRKTKEPAPEITTWLNEAFKEKGLLMSKGGIYGNVFRIIPPLVLTKADVDYIAWAVEDCIRRYK